MNYVIRNCIEDDLDKLIVLCTKHAAYEKADYDPTGKKENLRNALFGEEKMLNCLVVDSGGKAVGYASYTFDFSTWSAQKFIYLDCLYLEDEFRNFGIGQLLMEKLQEIGKANGCGNMQWHTPDFNVNAVRFYERTGASSKKKVRFTLKLE